MSALSSSITDGTAVNGETARFKLNLKSRWDNDKNEIISFRYRAVEDDGYDSVYAEGGMALCTGLDVSVGLFNRPPLSHYNESGVWVRGGNGALEVPTTLQAWESVSMMLKPIGTTRVATSSYLVTFTSSAGQFSLTKSDGGINVYVNGELWTSGSKRFPFNRLVTITYPVDQIGGIKVGNTWTPSGAADQFVVNRVGFYQDAVDAASHASSFYRKQNSDGVLSDSAGTGIITTSLVSLPDTWRHVSSS